MSWNDQIKMNQTLSHIHVSEPEEGNGFLREKGNQTMMSGHFQISARAQSDGILNIGFSIARKHSVCGPGP